MEKTLNEIIDDLANEFDGNDPTVVCFRYDDGYYYSFDPCDNTSSSNNDLYVRYLMRHRTDNRYLNHRFRRVDINPHLIILVLTEPMEKERENE